MTTDPTARPVLFFDGECNLCNSFVQFIIRHDRQKQFLFSPLQSPAGQQARLHIAQNANLSTVILLHNGRYLSRSAAALTVLKMLGMPWSLLYAATIFPAFLRNFVYDLIARNRYKWFGKRDTCMIPTPELMERFIS